MGLATTRLKIGWAEVDLTPAGPVLLDGQFYARISEEVMDPITATAWALEADGDHAVFVSCDFIDISSELLDAVRARLHGQLEDLNPHKVILNATHTHSGPAITTTNSEIAHTDMDLASLGIDTMAVSEYVAYAADRIADTVCKAWTSRAEGGIAYGQGYAVTGRNRRWIDREGRATMYGLDAMSRDSFRHIEGYEDHSVNVVAAYDSEENLTGLIVNVANPSQSSEHEYAISADYWHETRLELRKRFGPKLFILPQCSAAGDLSPHVLIDKEANDRMLKLKNRTLRQEIAYRLATEIEDMLPHIAKSIDTMPTLRHQVGTVNLPVYRLTEADALSSKADAKAAQAWYESELGRLEAHPEIRNSPRWYFDVTNAFGQMNWHSNVVRRFERQKSGDGLTVPVGLHAIRLGELAFVTHPFEYYVDYGIQIKVRSPAAQTFLIQLTRASTYLPSPRSVKGGSYGSVPGSYQVGPEGGQQLAEYTINVIQGLWQTTDPAEST